MYSIDCRQTNELLSVNLVDLESCFDPLFYPPEDFENTADNQRRENTPFDCMGKYKIGNTFYLVETQYDGKEPLPYILKRLIFSNRDLSSNTISLSKNFSDKKADNPPILTDQTIIG